MLLQVTRLPVFIESFYGLLRPGKLTRVGSIIGFADD